MDHNIPQQHVDPWDGYAMPFNKLSKVEGPFERHIEQLWDEVKKLRKELNDLKQELDKL